MTPTPKLPTNELGTPGGLIPLVAEKGKKPSWVVEALESNLDLAFPQSVPVYDAMRTQDGQVGSVLRSIVEMIKSAKWALGTEGVRPEVVELVRTELGLDLADTARARRRREGIVWKDHVATALETALWAGFAPFEQVYMVAPARPEQEATGLDQIVHLRKLAPRLPRSITKMETERDGGLLAVYQTNPDPEAKEDIAITVDRLVMYCHRREGADWTGRSILRQAYKYWIIKDVYLRLDAQAAERNSMGVPVIGYSDESQKAEAERVGAEFRAGSSAYVARPSTMSFELQGVNGSTVNLSPKIELLNQEISKSALAMFLDLGHDAGARSLGETFYDIFMKSLQSTAEWIAEVATEHIIRDLVELNFGVDEPYPVMSPGSLSANSDAPVEVIKQLVDAKLVTPDAGLEKHFRARYGLPEATDEQGRKAMSAEELVARGNFAQGLIRSGFTPAAALAAAGLDPIEHLGLLPVTLQPPAKGTDLPNAVPPEEDPGDGSEPAPGTGTESAADDAPFVDGWADIMVPARMGHTDPLDRATALLQQMVALRRKHGQH